MRFVIQYVIQRGVNMISVRLPKNLEEKINKLSKEKNITKSKLIKEALAQYIANNEKQKTSFELGENFFGKYGSNKGNLSSTYKRKIKEKINEKNTY